VKKLVVAIYALSLSFKAYSNVLYLECNGIFGPQYGGGDYWERIMLDTDKESGTRTWKAPSDEKTEITEPFSKVVITPEYYIGFTPTLKILELDRRDGSATFNGAEGSCAKVDSPKTIF